MPKDHDDDDAKTLVDQPDAPDTAVIAPPNAERSGPMPFEEHSFQTRYVSRRLLGRGGMGEVRLCSDLRIGRDVAMKVMRRATSGSSGLRDRFEREARLQGQLEHPAIVPVYDLGLTREGAWFTMKRVRGHTLERIVRGLAEGDAAFTERFTLRRLLVAFVQVTQAIAFAHSRNVVHRDLKPANVMLGDFGEVYVLDWGLGKVLGAAPESVEHDDDDVPTRAGDRTAKGTMLGTPGYMPPEQAIGQHDDIDARADVYSLGAMLYELLTLEPLHPRDSTDAAVQSTLHGADARASVHAPHRAPPELDAVCARATAVNPRDRYASARELAAEIERFLDGERDQAVRKNLAERHLAEARAAIARGARGEAMRALNRAIALDVSEQEALATMRALLLAPPGDPPREALAELEQTREDERRATARSGGIAFLSWFLLTPLLLWSGFRSPTQWLVLAAMFVTPALASLWFSRRKPTDAAGAVVLLACTTTIALASLHFGPFVLVPGWAAQNTLVFAMHGAPGFRRNATIAVGTLAFVVPLALELLGLAPPSFGFHERQLIIASRVAELAPLPTVLLLALVTVALIAIPAWIVGRAHDDAWAAKLRLAAHVWHLKQLAPDTEGDALRR